MAYSPGDALSERVANIAKHQLEQHYTTGAAGAALSLSPISVKLYCKRYGVGTKHGRDWLLTDADLDIIRNRRRNAARGET